MLAGCLHTKPDKQMKKNWSLGARGGSFLPSLRGAAVNDGRNIPSVLQRTGGKGAGEGMKARNWRGLDLSLVKAVGRSLVQDHKQLAFPAAPPIS